MRVFPVGVEHPLDVTVQRPQHLDPRNHEFLEEMRNYHRDEDFKNRQTSGRPCLGLAMRDHDDAWRQAAVRVPGCWLWQHALRQSAPERSGQAPQFARARLIIIKVVSIYSRHEEQFDLLS
jgi:hypothetical protein